MNVEIKERKSEQQQSLIMGSILLIKTETWDGFKNSISPSDNSRVPFHLVTIELWHW